MTLAELITQVEAVKIGGRLPLTADKRALYQSMAFDAVTQLCYPLNLSIPYQDKDIYRYIDAIDGVEWFLKKPRIAQNDTDFIDIDSRLDLALVYQFAAYMAADNDRAVLELRAERICVEYACEVLKMGLSKSKEVYEQESFLSGVRFDCLGQVYTVQYSFIRAVIDCLLCGSVCLNAAEKKQLDIYKGYLDGEPVPPVDLDSFRAIDIAVFMEISNHIEDYGDYTTEQLSTVTTLFCEFDKIYNDEAVEDWITEMDRRIEVDMRG